MPNTMQRFTKEAQEVLRLAQEEAEHFHHNFIDTEHLLLGLMDNKESIAGRVLRELGLEQQRVKELAERLTRAATRTGDAQLELSPTPKRYSKKPLRKRTRGGIFLLILSICCSGWHIRATVSLSRC